MVNVIPQPRYEARISEDENGNDVIEILHIPAVKVTSANGADLYNHPQATSGVMESTTVATMTIAQAAGLLCSLADDIGWLANTLSGKRSDKR